MASPHRPHRPRMLALGASVCAAALLAAGCGGGGGSGSGGNQSVKTQQKSNSLAGMIPQKVKSDGKVVVATDPSYAPNEFYATDNKTIIGMDPDLGKALGDILGVKFEFQKAGFDAIIPGLASGKYELGMSSFTDNKKREQTVDFVTYFNAGTSLMVKKGNPKKLQPTGNSLCGKKVAVEKGTVQEDPDIPDRTKKCQAAGKPGVKALVYPDQAGANLALSSGRADAVLADSPVAAYAAKQSNGQFQIVGASYGNAPYGIAIPKNDGDFAKAIQGAMQKLIKNGTYQQILSKWGIQAGAISKPVINGATG